MVLTGISGAIINRLRCVRILVQPAVPACEARRLTLIGGIAPACRLFVDQPPKSICRAGEERKRWLRRCSRDALKTLWPLVFCIVLDRCSQLRRTKWASWRAGRTFSCSTGGELS